MVDKIKSKFDWLFSGHYKMERFGVMFGSLMLAMAVLITTIVMHKMEVDRVQLGANAVYTTSFKMSLSQNAGNVVDVYVDSDRTQCFLLLKWANMNKVVARASDYILYLTGSDLNTNKTQLESSPAAAVYMFGTTGYMGIYLVDTNGFPSQILDLVIRCNTVVGGMPSEVPDYVDASFAQHDQARIYFNPGGSEATVAPFLDEHRLDIYDIYEGSAIVGQEDELKASLDAQLEAMQGQLALIDEYAARVDSYNIVVANAPIEIRGDKVVKDDKGNLELVTDYLIPGGYDYDWRYGSIQEGYLGSVVPANMSADRYIQNQRKLTSEQSFSTAGITWINKDGTVFEVNSNMLQSQSSAQAAITSLEEAWAGYYTMKSNYQVELLEQLLILELDTREAVTNYTVKTKDVIIHW